jgi:hypothetical protein
MKLFNRKPTQKITRTLLIAFLLMFSATAYAQITITDSDMPSSGDTVRRSLTTDFLGIDYTLTGPNYTWDFASLEPVTQTVDTFVTVSSVPFLYQLIFIPNVVANVAQKFSEIDTIPELPVTDPYRFYRKSSASYNDVGYAITVSGIPVPVRLNPADVIYKFPLAYGNIDSSDASGQLGVPGVGYIGIDRKRVNEVDGWGTLKTPFGTFDVLRLKSEVFESDSVFIDSLGFGQAINRNYIEYKWMTNGIIAPLLQVTEEGPVVLISYVDTIQGTTVNVAEKNLQTPSVHIAPNPVSEYAVIAVDIENHTHTSVTLLNAAGIKLLDIFEGYLPAGRHFFTLNTSNPGVSKGVGLIKVSVNNSATTKKIIIR